MAGQKKGRSVMAHLDTVQPPARLGPYSNVPPHDRCLSDPTAGSVRNGPPSELGTHKGNTVTEPGVDDPALPSQVDLNSGQGTPLRPQCGQGWQEAAKPAGAAIFFSVSATSRGQGSEGLVQVQEPTAWAGGLLGGSPKRKAPPRPSPPPPDQYAEGTQSGELSTPPSKRVKGTLGQQGEEEDDSLEWHIANAQEHINRQALASGRRGVRSPPPATSATLGLMPHSTPGQDNALRLQALWQACLDSLCVSRETGIKGLAAPRATGQVFLFELAIGFLRVMQKAYVELPPTGLRLEPSGNAVLGPISQRSNLELLSRLQVLEEARQVSDELRAPLPRLRLRGGSGRGKRPFQPWISSPGPHVTVHFRVSGGNPRDLATALLAADGIHGLRRPYMVDNTTAATLGPKDIMERLVRSHPGSYQVAAHTVSVYFPTGRPGPPSSAARGRYRSRSRSPEARRRQSVATRGRSRSHGRDSEGRGGASSAGRGRSRSRDRSPESREGSSSATTGRPLSRGLSSPSPKRHRAASPPARGERGRQATTPRPSSTERGRSTPPSAKTTSREAPLYAVVSDFSLNEARLPGVGQPVLPSAARFASMFGPLKGYKIFFNYVLLRFTNSLTLQ